MPAIGCRFESRSLAPGLTLHLQSSEKRKTNTLQVYWVGDLGPDVTRRALLPSCLLRGTRSHPSMKEMNRREEMLYGASLSGDVMKVGERHVIVFRLEFVNDSFLPAGESILTEVLEYCGEVLADPHLAGGSFPDDMVSQEKENHKRLIEGLLNSKRSYALQRAIEETCRDEEYRLYEQGRVDDLEEISPAELTDLWRRVLAGSVTHIYFSGNHDPAAAGEALGPLARGRGGEPQAVRDLRPLRGAGEPRAVVEELDIKQAKLVMSHRTRTRFGDPLLEAMVVANGILGLFPHSKLFLNVREKASLCYYASSILERTHGLMLISAGIDASRRTDAEALMKRQIDDLREGKISDEEMEATLRAFENRPVMLEDQ
ncbi:MAG: EF-P 5-aminopentanol modification-associated protein YfmF, partial [Planctomycetota bacterium]